MVHLIGGFIILSLNCSCNYYLQTFNNILSILVCFSFPENSSVLIKPWLTPSGSALRFPYPCQSMAVTKVNHEVLTLHSYCYFYLSHISILGLALSTDFIK